MIIKTKSKLDFILHNYSQVSIFATMFKVTVEDIEYCLEHESNKINNRLRGDVNPSLGFMYRDDGRLISKDWANDLYTGDMLDVLATIKGLNVRNDFNKLCDFIIDNNNKQLQANTKVINKLNKLEFSEFRYEIRQYTKKDLKYWNNGGVTLDRLNYRNIFAAKYLWINNMKEPYYVYSNYNPMYVYSLGIEYNKEIVKTYNPYSTSRSDRFRTNNKLIFEAPQELYDADILIITKSRKDKLVIECMLEVQLNISLYSIGVSTTYCVTSFNSEAYRIHDELAVYLKSHYKRVIINVDFDKTGILNAFYHNILYNFETVFLGNNTDIDITDKELVRYFASINKINKDITLFRSLLEYFINTNKDDFKQKDIFEYTSVHGINKGKQLVKKLFI
jgi:hypothetical protein